MTGAGHSTHRTAPKDTVPEKPRNTAPAPRDTAPEYAEEGRPVTPAPENGDAR